MTTPTPPIPTPPIPTPPTARPGEAGFSLAEFAVSVFVLVLLLVAALTVFDFNTNLARVQNSLTDMQQSMRIGQLEVVRQVRAAGRGGLMQQTPSLALPHQGAVIGVRDNVTGSDRDVVTGLSNTPQAVEGTDILTVRGNFSTPLYQVMRSQAGRNFFVMTDSGGPTTDSSSATGGIIQICRELDNGWIQPLEPLIEAITSGDDGQTIPEALVLTSTLSNNTYAVVALDPDNSLTTASLCNAEGGVTLAFDVTGGVANDYRELSPVTTTTGMMPNILDIGSVSILEEYRYFVREEREVPGDDTSALRPRLSRLRVLPNTDTARGGNLGLEDVAEGIFDLQVALGMDTATSGSVTQGSVAAGQPPLTETSDGASDDWLFNNPSDDPTATAWAYPGGSPLGTFARAPLFYVRVSTLGRVPRPDPKFEAPLLPDTENRSYGTADDDDLNSDTQRRYRRRVLTTLVDPRNL